MSASGVADTRAQLWIAFVSILATFNITKAKDADGKVIEVNDEYFDTGIIVFVLLPLSRREILIFCLAGKRNLSSARYFPGPEQVEH